MLINTRVTFYHYREEEETWERRFFEKAHCFRRMGAAIAEKGAVYANLLEVRIPGREELEIQAGDYLCLELGGSEPDKRFCHRVMAWSDNRRGASPHYHIICE